MITVNASSSISRSEQFISRYGINANLLVVQIDIKLCKNRPPEIAFRIHSDKGYTPALYDALHFTIQDANLPSHWRTTQHSSGIYIGSPDLSQEFFWEEFIDDNPAAIDNYNREIARLRADAFLR